MNDHFRGKFVISGFLCIAVLVLFLANVGLGPVNLSLPQIFNAFWGVHGKENIYVNILWKIRMPRALAAIFGGASLSLSGLLLQVLFSNPLADPFILGISSGASLFTGVIIFLGTLVGWNAPSPFLLTAAAFIGAMAVMSIVLAVAGKIKNVATLLIVGIMVGYLCSALTNLMTALAQKEQLHLFIIWSLGSFSGFSWTEVLILAVTGIFLCGGAVMICKPLNAVRLGEDYARSMGVNIRRLRLAIIFISCFLSATVTAFAGPVAFIGLAVPYLSRLLSKTSDNRILVPMTLLLGALLTSFCDLIARMALRPVEIPISVITSFFGVPLLILLLVRRNRSL